MPFRRWLERTFRTAEAGSSPRREVLAGATTYVAMCYIVFVNPAVLAAAGMDAGAVMMATCLASALATLWMAFHANYPIALAPGMGHNFFFALTVCGPVGAGGLGYTWQAALAATVLSGSLFILASFWGLRARIITVVPQHLQSSVGVGIGLLVAVVGLRWGGILVAAPGLHIGLGDLGNPAALTTLFGVGVIGVLLTLRASAALILGVFASALLAAVLGLARFDGVLGAPPSILPTFLALDFGALFSHPDFLSVVFVLLFIDLFDTVGTLIGVAERAGFLVRGTLPRAREALLADAVGTVTGGLLGTSTVTSYVESAAGVAAGGRTGLASLVTALLLAGSVFFYPLVRFIGGGFDAGGGMMLYPIIAPALITVGYLMMHGVGRIEWADPMQAVPAFLTIIIMPLATSITEGLAFGFIATSLLSLMAGKPRRFGAGVHVIGALFLLRYVFLR